MMKNKRVLLMKVVLDMVDQHRGCTRVLNDHNESVGSSKVDDVLQGIVLLTHMSGLKRHTMVRIFEREWDAVSGLRVRQMLLSPSTCPTNTTSESGPALLLLVYLAPLAVVDEGKDLASATDI